MAGAAAMMGRLLRRRQLPCIGALALSLAIPASAQTPRPTPPPQARAAPRLVVFLTIDQMRSDYFTRFGPQLSGGLGRLYRGGAVFTDAFQDHAITETAPGHASTLSGRFPQHTGIMRNAVGVLDRQSPLLTSNDPGASPFRFRGSTLIDWMRTRDPRSRALSISRKDRGAILPLGSAKQSIYWYAVSNGEFTTSRYYADTLPDWVKQVNARRVPQRATGRPWIPLLAADAYPEPDSVAVENGGRNNTFPHVLTPDPARVAEEFIYTPWIDALTLDAALEGLTALDLGRGPAPDLLAISLSATDYVGHRYGMDSRELHDQILRLDRSLGAFLDSLYKLRDSSGVIIALTADHAMAPYPELHFPGTDPMRGRVNIAPVLAEHRRRLVARGVDPRAIEIASGAVLFDPDGFPGSGVDRDSAARALVADLRRVPGVLEVELRDSLASAMARGNVFARRWIHSLPDSAPVVAVVTLQPYYYWGSSGATHGSPHDYDAHVPVLFYGAPFRPGKYGEFARVVDMAPTLAAALGVTPTERLDGHVLRGALR